MARPPSVRSPPVPFEDHPEDDDGEPGPPLPPEDRLWRHPSELGAAGRGQRIELVTRPATGRLWLVGVLAALLGAGATVGILTAAGAFDASTPGTAVERVATGLPDANEAQTLDIAEPVLPAVVRLETWGPEGMRQGTAVIVRDDGVLLCTSDLVDGVERIDAQLQDGTVLTAELVGRDRGSDVAVLKVDGAGLPVAVLREGRTTDHLAFGDATVLIDAAPDAGPTPALIEGFVSEASRRVERDQGEPMYGMLQVSTRPRANDTGTGRLLIDDAGAVVGIVSGRGQDAAGAEDGLALQFATPIDHARRVLDDVLDDGRVSEPQLGVVGGDVDPGDAERLNARNGGMYVESVDDGGPAAAAGLTSGDVIVGVDGETVTDLNDLVVLLRGHRPGDTVAVTYVRDAEEDVALAVLATKGGLP